MEGNCVLQFSGQTSSSNNESSRGNFLLVWKLERLAGLTR